MNKRSSPLMAAVAACALLSACGSPEPLGPAPVRVAAGTGFNFNGYNINGNSTTIINTYSGMLFDSGGGAVTNFLVNGSTLGGPNWDPGGVNGQKYGIEITAGCDGYVVTGNNTLNNQTAGILNTPGAAATRVVANNI